MVGAPIDDVVDLPVGANHSRPVPKKVLILGGGLSALTAGITLLDQGGAAEFDVTVVCMEHRLGGKASSWQMDVPAGDPARYMEIGFHAIFGYYSAIRKLLRRVGRPVTDPRWFRSGRGVQLMYEAGKARTVNRLDIPKGPMDIGAAANIGLFKYKGMSLIEKAAAGLWMGATVARLKLADVDPALDEEAFTDYCIRTGLLPSLTQKSWFKYILDLAFNYPHAGSAYVGMAGFKKLAGPEESTVYYFNGPMSDVMIAPLASLFKSLGGKIEFCTKAVGVELDATASKLERVTTQLMATPVPIAGVDDYVTPTPIGPTYPLEEDPYPPIGDPQPPAAAPSTTLVRGADFDEVIWTLPVDSTRALLDTTPDPASQVHAFSGLANIWSLETIAPISARVWSPKKLLPSTFEGVVMGTPQPAATIIDWANRIPELRHGPYASVVEFEGQEGNHGALSDTDLMRTLLENFRDLPFAIARNVDINAIMNQTDGYRWHLRRNTAHHVRYLLMKPGHWKYRPLQDGHPYDNLLFAGDWMRGEQETASMEAAVRTGRFAGNKLRDDAGLPLID